MGDETAAALASLLEAGAMPKLKTLRLDSNRIGEAGRADGRAQEGRRLHGADARRHLGPRRVRCIPALAPPPSPEPSA